MLVVQVKDSRYLLNFRTHSGMLNDSKSVFFLTLLFPSDCSLASFFVRIGGTGGSVRGVSSKICLTPKVSPVAFFSWLSLLGMLVLWTLAESSSLEISLHSFASSPTSTVLSEVIASVFRLVFSSGSETFECCQQRLKTAYEYISPEHLLTDLAVCYFATRTIHLIKTIYGEKIRLHSNARMEILRL